MVVHSVIDYYERLGPTTQRLRADIGYPIEERTTRESWNQAGPDGSVARARTEIRSVNGAVLARHEVDGTAITVRLPDGSIAQEQYPGGRRPAQASIGRLFLPQPAAAAAARLADIARSRTALVTDARESDGTAIKRVVERSKYSHEALWPTGYSLPFMDDLDPQEMEHIWIFSASGDRLISYQQFVIDGRGNRVLVQEIRTLIEEVLPIGRVPAGVFATID